ncbi:MAG TPA: hypothetical protein VKT82_19720 [Ktedonobacterales bacterium]|nr:hypothetical protein [Ktedonobacterales bacterium]
MLNDVPDLWIAGEGPDVPLRYDARPVAGLMAAFVGRQYTEEEVWQYCRRYRVQHVSQEAELRPLAARIRAFDVPVLAQAELQVSRLAELPGAVYDLLSARLPGWQWDAQQKAWRRQHMTGPVKKYAILHTDLRAPIDETTQQPMVLELFGRVTALNGQPVGIGWFGPRQEDRAAEDAIFLGELRLTLERATYANTDIPGIGVPFYM